MNISLKVALIMMHDTLRLYTRNAGIISGTTGGDELSSNTLPYRLTPHYGRPLAGWTGEPWNKVIRAFWWYKLPYNDTVISNY